MAPPRPHYLGVDRDDGIVLVQITLARGRPVEKKQALYRRIAEVLSERAAADLA
jgi:4-oxalocrotonate tautomerase